MSKTGHAQTSAGSFATARRGGLSSEEIRMAEALRARERPVSWQNLARRFGCSEIDLRRALGDLPGEAANDTTEERPPEPEGDWSERRCQAFARLWNDGYLAEDIAVTFGITVSAVKARRAKMGLPPRVPGSRVVWGAG